MFLQKSEKILGGVGASTALVLPNIHLPWKKKPVKVESGREHPSSMTPEGYITKNKLFILFWTVLLAVFLIPDTLGHTPKDWPTNE